jgi:hypothetical protein
MLTYAYTDVVGEYREMKAYRLYTVVPRLLKFMDDLTNWYVIINRNTLNQCAAYAERMLTYADVCRYVKMNRNRLKGVKGPAESLLSIRVLFQVPPPLSQPILTYPHVC